MKLDTVDGLDNIATELHGLGDIILFLSQSEMDAGCGEGLGFLEWSVRKIEDEVRDIIGCGSNENMDAV